MSPQNGKAATSAEAIVCPKDEILRRLQRETTCSSCCSALRVMIQRPLTQLSLLEAFVSHEDSLGYVLKESLASPSRSRCGRRRRPPSAAAPSRRARRAPARAAPTPAAPAPARRAGRVHQVPAARVAQELPAAQARQAVPDARQLAAHLQLSRPVGGHVGGDGRRPEGGDLQREHRGAARQIVAALHRQAPPVQGLPQQRDVGVRQADEEGLRPRGHAAQLPRNSGGPHSTLRAISTPPATLQAPRRSRRRSTPRSRRTSTSTAAGGRLDTRAHVGAADDISPL